MEFLKFIIKDFLLSFVVTVLSFLIFRYLLNINNNILPYLTATVFGIVLLISVFMSFYMFHLKEKIDILNIQIEKLSKFDEATNVFKRFYILEMLKQYINIAKRKKMPLSVMLIDIDKFNEINKNYGHRYGDEILKDFASVLKKEIRGMDIVGRYGGDEFLVVGFATLNEFTKLANRIHDKFHLNKIGSNHTELSVSIGISELRYDDNNERIIKRVEEALFLAKQKGGDRVDYLEHFLLFE